MSKKLDLTAVWDDARAMGVASRDLLSAIAGMFLFLPAIIASHFVSTPTPLGDDPTNEQVFARLAQYGTDNWQILLLHAIVTSFGVLALHSFLLRPERLTVGESLQAAMPILLGYVLANLLQGLGVMSGMLLFMVPGLYLIGRLALIAPVAAAERLSNPLTILRRSAELTHGNGWRIFGLLAIIFMTMFVIRLVLASLIGIVAQLVLPGEAATLAVDLASALVETAMAVVMVLVCAALYRATRR